MSLNGNRRLLKVRDAAAYVGLSSKTLYNQIGRKAGKRFPVKPIRRGRMVLFDRVELDKWIDAGCPEKWESSS